MGAAEALVQQRPGVGPALPRDKAGAGGSKGGSRGGGWQANGRQQGSEPSLSMHTGLTRLPDLAPARLQLEPVNCVNLRVGCVLDRCLMG